MLLTFLEAKNILLHRDRCPVDEDLKLRAVTVFSLLDPLPFETLTNAVDPGSLPSKSDGFFSPGFAPGLPEDLEDDEHAVKRGRFL